MASYKNDSDSLIQFLHDDYPNPYQTVSDNQLNKEKSEIEIAVSMPIGSAIPHMVASTPVSTGAPIATDLSALPKTVAPASLPTRVKLPGFWKSEPELWFSHVEAIFFINNINTDDERYYNILAALESPDVLNEIIDVIRSPPREKKYQFLKIQLISRFSDTKEQQLNKLLTETVLADKKPSQLLREMLKLAPSNTPEAFIHTLWIQRLPISVRCILSANQETNLIKLAEMADRIIEHSTIANTREIHALDKVPHSDRNELRQRFDNLEQQVKELILTFKKKHDKNKSYSVQPVKQQEANQSNQKICFYHRRFSAQARKCTPPCEFAHTKQQKN